MMTPISQLATIQAGYQPPGPTSPAEAGTHVLLPASGLTPNGQIVWPEAGQRMLPARRVDLYEVHAGDILLLVKGQRFTAGWVAYEPPIPTIAGPQFLVLRLAGEQVDPAFLAWFLNRPSTQGLFVRAAKGTAIPFLPRDAVENLSIPCPPLFRQRQVLQIRDAAVQLKALSDRWHHLQSLLIDHACADLIASHS